MNKDAETAAQLASQSRAIEDMARNVSAMNETLKSYQGEIFGREGYPGLRGRVKTLETELAEEKIKRERGFRIYLSLFVVAISAAIKAIFPGDSK